MTRAEIQDALNSLRLHFDNCADARRVQDVDAIRIYIARLEARGVPIQR